MSASRAGGHAPPPTLHVTPALGVDAVLAVASATHGPEAHWHLPTTGVRERAGHDHLRDVASATAFLVARREFAAPREPLGPGDLATLRLVRDATQALARRRDGAYRRALSRLLPRASFALDPDRRLLPVSRGWSGLAAALLPALLALAEERDQLKVCANPRCRWLFVDRSRNRSRVWCDPTACGNRMAVRRFRARARRRRPSRA